MVEIQDLHPGREDCLLLILSVVLPLSQLLVLVVVRKLVLLPLLMPVAHSLEPEQCRCRKAIKNVWTTSARREESMWNPTALTVNYLTAVRLAVLVPLPNRTNTNVLRLFLNFL